MAFDGTEGGTITASEGAALTAEYRQLNPDETKSHFFGKDLLNEILDQPGCMGIRVYYGVDSDTGKKELVIVGADADEEDMMGIVGDRSIPCPNRCPKNGVLNR